MTPRVFLKKIWLVGLFWGQIQNAVCQQVVIDRYTKENGLSFNFVFDVLQDKRGFIWCSTGAGLNRFDGVQFTHYLYDPQSQQSPSGNRGSEIYEDKNGYIWYVTLASGVNRYDPTTNAFKQFNYPVPGSNEPSRIGYTFAEDRYGKLFMLSEQGLCVYNEEQEKIELYRTRQGDSIWLKRANVLFFNHENELFIGAEKGVYQIDLNSGNVRRLPGSGDFNADTYDIIEDKRGHLIFATWGGGVIDFNPADESYKRYYGGKPNYEEGYSIFVDLELLDQNGNEIIIASTRNHSLMSIDPESEKTDYFDLRNVMNDDEPSVYSNNITVDNNNNIWIATSGGLMKIDPLRQLFKTFGVDPSIQKDWFTDVTAIYQDPKDKSGSSVWYAVPKNGLFITNLVTNESRLLRFPADLGNEVHISQILRFNENEILFAGNCGLLKYNESTKKWTQYVHNKNDSTSISGNFTSKILIDRSGNIWISTHGYGLNLYNSTCDCFERFTISENKLYDVYLSDNINDISLGADDNLWIARGYRTGYITGISKFNTRTHDQVHYFRNKQTFTDFPLERDIFSVLEDDDGLIWIGSEQGVLRFDPSASKKEDRYVQFTLFARMPSDAAFALEQSGKYMWVASDAGIAIIDKDALEVVRTYEKTDGLLTNNPSSFISGFDNHIFIGGPMGFQTISLDQIKPNKSIPPVYITSLRVLDKEYYNEGQSVLAYNEVKLPFDQNKLTISFTALNFTNAQNNRFKYKLEGFDAEWTYTTERVVHFNNLPHGRYVFKVLGSNDNGVWNEVGDTLYITVTPPWYKTAWFYLACVLIISGILYGIYRIRVAQILRIERLRNKISSDLHDDVGSSLSSINMLSAIAKKKAQLDPDQAEDLMQRINTTTRHTIENMSDIVWTINPKNDKLSDFLVRMQEYLTDTLEVQGIDYTCNIEERLLKHALPMEVRRDFFLIFKEAVNNAAKYAEATRLNVSVFSEGRTLFMKVSDNGCGFDPSTIRAGNGLSNMRTRAMRIGGNVIVDSAPMQGCSVVLTLPLN